MLQTLVKYSIIEIYASIFEYSEIRHILYTLNQLETNIRIVNYQLESLNSLLDEFDLNIGPNANEIKLAISKASLEILITK
ncbi:MAG: hypothetical protein ACRCXZ_08830 [Patescibacteria group bacterium]